MGRLFGTLVLLPLGVVLVVLAVANRAPVRLSLDPFSTPPAVAVDVPLFLVVFGAVMLGVVAGALATRLSRRPRPAGRPSSPSSSRAPMRTGGHLPELPAPRR